MKLAMKTCLWFVDEDNIVALDNKFTFMGILICHLLNEKYIGKKIDYLNLTFHKNDKKLKEVYGNDYYLHFYGGSLMYKKVVDLNKFLTLNFTEQKLFIWNQAFEMLKFAGKELKNESLIISSEYAYNKGLELKLIADYRMIENDLILFGENFKASLWVNFLENKMQANFTLVKNNEIIFNKIIGEAPNGMEFFLVMFKKIEQKDNTIIIKGLKDVDYLPLKIIFNENLEEII